MSKDFVSKLSEMLDVAPNLTLEQKWLCTMELGRNIVLNYRP